MGEEQGGDGEAQPGREPAQEARGPRGEGGLEAAGAAPREEARHGGGGEEAPRRVEGVLQQDDGGVRGRGEEGGRCRGRGVSVITVLTGKHRDRDSPRYG